MIIRSVPLFDKGSQAAFSGYEKVGRLRFNCNRKLRVAEQLISCCGKKQKVLSYQVVAVAGMAIKKGTLKKVPFSLAGVWYKI